VYRQPASPGNGYSAKVKIIQPKSKLFSQSRNYSAKYYSAKVEIIQPNIIQPNIIQPSSAKYYSAKYYSAKFSQILFSQILFSQTGIYSANWEYLFSQTPGWLAGIRSPWSS
jgi:hypothetical protein